MPYIAGGTVGSDLLDHALAFQLEDGGRIGPDGVLLALVQCGSNLEGSSVIDLLLGTRSRARIDRSILGQGSAWA